MTPLHYLSAEEALRLFRTRQLSPVELMRAVVERAERVEPDVNAFAEQLFEQALRAAVFAEKQYAPGGRPRPLEGLPIAAKEEQPLAGHPVTDATLLRPPTVSAGNRDRAQPDPGGRRDSARSHDDVRVLLHAAVPNATRGNHAQPVEPADRGGRLVRRFGRGAGGRTAFLATGSDIGGSPGAPASFTGVVGFKPPHGRNPVLLPAGLDTCYHHGPMARTVADCALLQNVMAGEAPRDPRSRLPPARIDVGEVRGLRIACCAVPGDFPVDSEVAASTRAVAHALASAGAVVTEVELDWTLDLVKQALWAHFGTGLAAEVLELDRQNPGVITSYCRAFARKGVENIVDTETGRAVEAAIRERLDAVFTRFDALIVPALGATAFGAGEDCLSAQVVVNGAALEHFSDASLTPAFNVGGVPAGVQVVAGKYGDGTTFRVGAAIEQTVGAGFARISSTGQEFPQMRHDL
nr:amidase [Amycolatopsis echigonensis]